ncbi:fibropellin-1-like [Branchiostoma lanceolatum]|uniref:fibropellin-1-like n=1 Tax=Branchiostoma lanceolatum TaxID=7740 RepID=UPI00345319F5
MYSAKDIDNCASDPCPFDGQVCVDFTDAYACICPPGTGSCATDFVFHNVVEQDKCYHFSKFPWTHQDAVANCAEIGGQQPDMKEPREHQWIVEYLQTEIGTSSWTALKTPPPSLVQSYASAPFAQPQWIVPDVYGPFDLCVMLDSTNNYTGKYVACTERYGFICTTAAAPCSPNVCQNGGNCTFCFSGFGAYSSFGSFFQCACPSGYTGTFCDADIDECLSSPCQHGGTCHDQIDSYSCQCGLGYAGDSCEIDQDLCAIYPCPDPLVCVETGDFISCHLPHPMARLAPARCGPSSCPTGWTCQEAGRDAYSCIP